MKHFTFILIALVISSSIGCYATTNISNNPTDSLTNTSDTHEYIHPSLLDDDPYNDTTIYTLEDIIELRDTLIGNFSGDGIDTLIAEPIGFKTLRKNFRIYSTSGKIKPLYVYEIWDVRMISEEDLDGNGTDEFGIRWELEMGNWTTYYIFTYLNNQWNLLTEPLVHYASHFYEDLEVVNAVKPSKKKGYIEGTNSHSGDDFWIEYKRIKINPQPLPKSIIHFGDIVE